MQWPFAKRAEATVAPEEFLAVGERRLRMHLVRNLRARRYVLRLKADGAVRVTVPRAGTLDEARQFAARQVAWIERQLALQQTRPTRAKEWLAGMEIWFRGQQVKIELAEGGVVEFGGERIQVAGATAGLDLRGSIEWHLRRLAAVELPPRVMEFAALHQLQVRRVSVRDQRSRWGSCSRRGTISLNWRLVQTPVFVRDYIILHELMHMRQMNHSDRFWGEVAKVCPDYAAAELWLKRHARLIR
jgi:predicted metal-dependent hydrolase